jgi:hypothetical protein
MHDDDDFLETLSALESNFDNAFKALIKHTGASGVRSVFDIDGKNFLLVIEDQSLNKRSLVARIKSVFQSEKV